jgi:hypothetical protein
MKKFSVLIFTITSLLFTPLFFCNAIPPVDDTSTTPEVLLSSSSVGSSNIDLVLSGLTSDFSSAGVIKIINDSNTSVVVKTINTTGNGTYIVKGLNSNTSYIAYFYLGSSVRSTVNYKFTTLKTGKVSVLSNDDITAYSIKLQVEIPKGSAYLLQIYKANSSTPLKFINNTSGSTGVNIETFNELLPNTSYKVSLFNKADNTLLSEYPFITKSVIGKLFLISPADITPYSIKLQVEIPKDSIYFLQIYKANSNTPLKFINNTSSSTGINTETFSDLIPNTSYKVSLFNKADNIVLSEYPFITKTASSPTLNTYNITKNSVGLEFNNLIPNKTFPIFIINQDDETITNIEGEITSDNTGYATKEFSGLVKDSKYIAEVDLKKITDGGNYTLSVNFKTLSEGLNFDKLDKKIEESRALYGNAKEGKKIGQYQVGSISELTKETERIVKLSLDYTVYSTKVQADVDLLVKQLSDAITLFESKKVTTSSGSSISLSSKAGGLVPDCPDKGCGWGELMVLVNNVIKFLLFTIATPLVALILVYAGWLYLSSGGSSENIVKAKKILLNVVVGYVIGLAAWLIVRTIVTSLGVDPALLENYLN